MFAIHVLVVFAELEPDGEECLNPYAPDLNLSYTNQEWQCNEDWGVLN